MLSLTKGYFMDPHEVLRSAKFNEEYSQMVIVKDIDFFSLCEHHMLPFYGKAHVAYIPNGTENRVLKSQGFRVQVYAGNNTSRAKNEAHAVGSRIKEYFPELSVYTSFNSPRWLCRVGDFRSIEEADAMMRQLRATGVFKEVSIVKEQINIPL